MNNLRIILVSVFNIIAASIGCRFGADLSCAFPCNCASESEVCDPDTGACPQTGCRQTLPAEYGWGGEGCLVGNVAFGKSATQSGDYSENGKIFYAQLAVDGNTNPDYSAGYCSYTAPEGAPRAWWQVDLGALHVILNVTIYNRDGYYSRRTNLLSILVGRTESDFTQCARLDSQVPGGEHETFPCARPLVGRYIKLEKDAGLDYLNNLLNICEIIAMGYMYTECTSCPSTSACSNLTGCDACPAGKLRPDCVLDCPAGTYGVNCAYQCSDCRDATENCDSATGNCPSGCPDWFVGAACNMELAFPDMSAPVYTPVVSAYSYNSVTIQWKKLSSVPDGQFYMYAVEYKKRGATFLVFTLINHNEGPQEISIMIGDLDQNTHYIFRIIPSRNISTDEYKNRAQQYGEPTSEVSQITDCPFGMYADKCCFCRNVEESCAKGMCSSGCQDWFVGEACDKEITSPDMSGLEYTPQLVSVTQTSITIKWKLLDSVPDENYYFYQVEFHKNEDGFNTFLIQSHDTKSMDQVTLFDDLESGHKYSFRILPFRNIKTDKFNNRQQEFGRNTEILTQNTVSTLTSARPVESTASSAEAAHSECVTVTIILGVLVGILAVALVAAGIIIFVQYRKSSVLEETSPSRPNQSVYYNVNSTTESCKQSQINIDVRSESARQSRNLSDDVDSGYTTPQPPYSLNQVSEYEDLPPVPADYETVN